jgi:hypothetical protein
MPLPGASRARVPLVAFAPRLKRFPDVPALFRRREVWLPTAWGLLLGLLILAGSAVLLGRAAYGFFAVDEPLTPLDGKPTPVLVVEGWIDEEALAQAAAVVRSAGYTRVIVSGGPIDDSFSRHPTYADRAAEVLRPQLLHHRVVAARAGQLQRRAALAVGQRVLAPAFSSACSVAWWRGRRRPARRPRSAPSSAGC